MTLTDIYHGIINYNLENIGKDFVIPTIKVIFFFGVGLFIFFGLIFIILYFSSEFFNIFKDKKNQVESRKFEIHKKEWVKVGNREGLYCYYCTKKLTIESWKNAANYYCEECYQKLSACNE